MLNTLGEAEPFAPRLSYNAVADSKGTGFARWRSGFNGDIHSVKGVRFVVREKARTPRFWQPATLSSLTTPPRLRKAYRDGNLNGTV